MSAAIQNDCGNRRKPAEKNAFSFVRQTISQAIAWVFTKKTAEVYKEKTMKNLSVLLIIFAAATYAADAQIASGGSYTLDQSVIATGGGSSTNGQFTIEDTTGQAIAGTRSTNSSYRIDGGFWTAQPLAPTAASVSLGGQITTADGRGIRNVFVTLTEADGTTQTALTASFGYFRFDEVSAGQTVIISVRAKRYEFARPTAVLNVGQDSGIINFVADN